ncbi:MAG: protein-L-isoaspartate O-methyltransferase [Rhodospirillaceae bacterium]|nr:protein-L-isoaspartate O-methyltransferase [Rhodospirillaceae bacterium]MBT5659830.1 protein-L-isoaspartate O-methyltransferase [Rhodospirillaceae bacterium]MBT5752862.1 protein-L-isoaspartate O-methyltransferase [Rhodospirillaceae bacterium]
MPEYEARRHNMVESQIRTNKVTDPGLIAVFSELPRELFLPEAQRSIAYIDEDIEIAPGRFLMEPMVLARLIQSADISKNDMVLDIGCAFGYATAILARLANTVVGLESDKRMIDKANSILGELVVDNVALMNGPLDKGFSKQAPYDVILIGGAVESIPAAITKQLAEGGRLVTVISDGTGTGGSGTLVLRQGKDFSSRALFDASTPILPGFQRAEEFIF